MQKCLHGAEDQRTLSFEMTVFPSGSNRIRRIRSDFQSQAREKCILSLLEKIRFPPFKKEAVRRSAVLRDVVRRDVVRRFYKLQLFPDKAPILFSRNPEDPI